MKKLLPVILRDGAGISGTALIAYGTWCIYEPAGYIVFGAMLVAGAWRAAKVQS